MRRKRAMLLSREDILKEMEKGEIKIENYKEELLGMDSLDLRLDNKILEAVNINEVIDPKKPKHFWREVEISNGYILRKNQFILASTIEAIGLGKSIAAQIEGRSSIGRLGIMVHVTAGIIHAGFGIKKPSKITLEVYSLNPNPVKIFPGMRIAQLAFFKLSKPVEKAYDEIGRYRALKGPTPPKPL